jgi:hypothetical protein
MVPTEISRQDRDGEIVAHRACSQQKQAGKKGVVKRISARYHDILQDFDNFYLKVFSGVLLQAKDFLKLCKWKNFRFF